MKHLPLACLTFSTLVACVTEPAEPPGPTPSAPATPPLVYEASQATPPPAPLPSSIAAAGYRDEQCLQICTGDSQFRACVPICRREYGPVFSLEPIELIPARCGDGICQLPMEVTGGEQFCRRDCFRDIYLAPHLLALDGKVIAEASEQGVRIPPEAFEAFSAK
jgi:hypothetical protein